MKHTITELLIYQLKSSALREKSFIIHEVNEKMNRYPGFIHRKVHQSLNEVGLWMDIVQWQSLSAAKQAARQLQKSPVFDKFFSQMRDILIFEYLQTETNYQSMPPSNLEAHKIVEVAMYNHKSPRGKRHSPRDITIWKDQKLRLMEGCVSRQTFSACQEQNLLFDYILWENWEQAHRAKRSEESKQRILSFFGTRQQNLISDHFKLLN